METGNDGALNILILSCGTRNKIVQYFKRELNGRGQVIATDCSKLAPALYEADKHYVVPRIDDKDYLDVILNICKKNNVKAVLTLIDPELSLLAKHRKRFEEIGVVPIVSDYETVELCFDKYRMANFLTEHGFQTAKSYVTRDEFYVDLESGNISYPVFVKPVKGSASININKVNSSGEIDLLFAQHDNLMIQEFMDGQELGADVYIDLISGEPSGIFLKEKILMRAGETDKSVSIKDDKLFDLIRSFVKKLRFKGVIDMDIFWVDGTYYISEINPRFGGGYPHAHECGVNMVNMLIQNINKVANKSDIGHYDEDVYMMKYSAVKITL